MSPEARGMLLRLLAMFLTLFVCFTVTDLFIESTILHLFAGLLLALAVAPFIRIPLDRHIARTIQADKDTPC